MKDTKTNKKQKEKKQNNDIHISLEN